MKAAGKFKKFYDVKNSAGFALVGFVIFAIALAALVLSSRSDVEWIETEAKIVEIIETKAENSNDTEYDVTVEYTAHGKKYTEKLPAFDSSWKKGDIIKCEYKADEPDVIQKAGGTWIALIFAVVGFASFVFGAKKTVKGLKKPAEEYDEHDKAVMYTPDPETVREIENSTEPARNYVFHFTGKLNQSHVMKNEAAEPVFEGNCRKMELVRDTEYDFVDVLTGETELHRIGHTVTRSVGTVLGFIAPISSSFTIDGEDIWDWFAKQGYGFTWSHKGIKSIYSVTRWQIPIATIEEAGTEIMGEKYEGRTGSKLPSKGLYRISCRESDRKAMFMMAFTLSRIELFGGRD